MGCVTKLLHDVVSEPWAAEAIGSFAGALIGFLGGYWIALREEAGRRVEIEKTRERFRQGHLEAVRAEIIICGRLATIYVAAGIAAPAYRVPTLAYESSLPALLADGFLSGTEAGLLLHYYVTARSFNLCLDFTHAVQDIDERFGAEAGRACIKACDMRTGGPHYRDAMAVLAKHVKTPLPELRELDSQ